MGGKGGGKGGGGHGGKGGKGHGPAFGCGTPSPGYGGGHHHHHVPPPRVIPVPVPVAVPSPARHHHHHPPPPKFVPVPVAVPVRGNPYRWRPSYHPVGHDIAKAVAFGVLTRELACESARRGRINLARSSVAAADLCMLLEAIKQYNYPMGTVLDLSDNPVGDLGCRYIADALMTGRCPVRFNISMRRCGVNLAGCRYLADALSHHLAPAYCTLDISHNPGVGPRGINAFVASSMRPVSAQKRWSVRVSPREVIRPYVPNTPAVRSKARLVGPVGLMALGFGAAFGAVGRLFGGPSKAAGQPAAAAAAPPAVSQQAQLEALYTSRRQMRASGIPTVEVDLKIVGLGGTVPIEETPPPPPPTAASPLYTSPTPSAPPATGSMEMQAKKLAAFSPAAGPDPAKIAEIDQQIAKLTSAKTALGAAGLSTQDVDNSIAALEAAKTAPPPPTPVIDIPATPTAAPEQSVDDIEKELASLVQLKATLEALAVPTGEVTGKIAALTTRRTEVIAGKIVEIEAQAARVDDQITALNTAKQSMAAAGLPTAEIDAKVAGLTKEKDDILASAPKLGVATEEEEGTPAAGEDQPPERFLCGISKELMANPVTVNKHDYERANIIEYLRSSERKVCPADNETPIAETDVQPNSALLKEINDWLTAHPNY
ncbi:hypothetical protein DIPPA_06227 [Diplonema papillatum]|nr:hypothetical protein DIPPA_06227 [Diplonema papillatum]